MRRRIGRFGSMCLLGVALTVVLSGCGTVSRLTTSDEALTTGLQGADAVATELALLVAGDDPGRPAPSVTAETEALDVVVTEQLEETLVESDGGPALLSLVEETALPAAPTLLDLGGVSALAQGAQDSTEAFDEEYDPWEPFNEEMFEFNRGVDRWVLKPVARTYMFVMPEPWQVLISNGFDNINFVPRLINSTAAWRC